MLGVAPVPPAYISQTCSGCGVVVQKGLSVRWRSCCTAEQACIEITTRRRIERGFGKAFGEGLGHWPRRTENPSGFSPCGVSRMYALMSYIHVAAVNMRVSA